MRKEDPEELFARVKSQEHSANIYTPVSQLGGQPPDCELEYEFDIAPELSHVRLRQGIRCEFLYEGDDPKLDGVHLVLLEFLDANGKIITDKTQPLSKSGRVLATFAMPEIRARIHQRRLKKGGRGFLTVSGWRLAKVLVSELVALNE